MVDFFEHIDAYKNNQLSAEELASFEKAMSFDPKLQSAVDNYELIKTISLRFIEEETRAILQESASSTSNIEEYKTTAKFHKKKLWLWALIVVGLIIAALSYKAWLSNRTAQRIEFAMRDYTPPQVVFNRSIEQSEELSTLDQAKDAFSKKDVAKAKEILLSEAAKKVDQDQKYWMLGHIYFIERDYDASLQSLQKISDTTAYQNDIYVLKSKIAYIEGK